MGLRIKEFLCEPCNNIFEGLVDSTTDFEPCPLCSSPSEKILSAPRIGLYNDPTARNNILRKRSADHSAKEAKKDGFQEQYGLPLTKKGLVR